MKYVVEKIEGEIVMCENFANGEMKMFSRSNMPPEIAEGDMFDLERDKFTILKDETTQRKAMLKKRLDDLFA